MTSRDVTGPASGNQHWLWHWQLSK